MRLVRGDSLEGLGFDYGWRGEYDFAKHWGVGVEMFGEIEDLANAGRSTAKYTASVPRCFTNLVGTMTKLKPTAKTMPRRKVVRLTWRTR